MSSIRELKAEHEARLNVYKEVDDLIEILKDRKLQLRKNAEAVSERLVDAFHAQIIEELSNMVDIKEYHDSTSKLIKIQAQVDDVKFEIELDNFPILHYNNKRISYQILNKNTGQVYKGFYLEQYQPEVVAQKIYERLTKID